MTDPQHPADLLFGTNVVAMVTPMQPDGTISEPGLARPTRCYSSAPITPSRLRPG
jgi:hypothetical protein